MAERTTERIRMALGLGAASTGLYALLLTRQYAGDGLRWMAAMIGPWPPDLGGTNHLLFPMVGLLWYHGVGARLPGIAPLQALQMMNALAAGIGVALFMAIVLRLGVSRRIAWWSSLCLIFANAYWVNATDMVEVMPSIPLIFFGIWLTLPRERATAPLGRSRYLLAAVALALATAIYQASAFSLIALLAALGWQPNRTVAQRLSALAQLLGMYAMAVGAVYLIALRYLGDANSWAEALRLSLQTESPYAFGGFDVRHVAGSLFGWVAVWLSLFNFQGISHLLRTLAERTSRVNLLLVALQYGLAAAIVWPIVRRPILLTVGERRALSIAAFWFIAPFLFTIYWLPAYGKLWISPLAATIAALAVLLTAAQRASGRARFLANGAALTLCALTISINLAFGLLPSRFAPNRYQQDAVQLAARMTPGALVITDGWGPTATYLRHFTDRAQFGYAGLALAHAGDNDFVGAELARQISEAQAQGHSVYFLGMLDLTVDDWRPLFGERFGMDYVQLSQYRATARPVVSLTERTLSGSPLHLWELSSPEADSANRSP